MNKKQVDDINKNNKNSWHGQWRYNIITLDVKCEKVIKYPIKFNNFPLIIIL